MKKERWSLFKKNETEAVEKPKEKYVETFTGPKVCIPHQDWMKLKIYAHEAAPNEISGLGRAKVEGNRILLSDIFLLPQIVTPSSTELSGAAIANLLATDAHPEEILLWFHSHGRSGVFWSGQDRQTIERFSSVSGWLVSLVLNANAEVLVRLDVSAPVSHTIECALLVDEHSQVMINELREEIKQNVKPRLREHLVENYDPRELIEKTSRSATDNTRMTELVADEPPLKWDPKDWS